MEDGNLEVGVHIADVSYFVEEYTALDETARSRATSVYLTQKVIIIISSCLMSSCIPFGQVIPMLPRLLCEQLCSLNPDEVINYSIIMLSTNTHTGPSLLLSSMEDDQKWKGTF